LGFGKVAIQGGKRRGFHGITSKKSDSADEACDESKRVKRREEKRKCLLPGRGGWLKEGSGQQEARKLINGELKDLLNGGGKGPQKEGERFSKKTGGGRSVLSRGKSTFFRRGVIVKRNTLN